MLPSVDHPSAHSSAWEWRLAMALAMVMAAPSALAEPEATHRHAEPARRPTVEIQLSVDGAWRERGRGLEFHADRGGPDLCRQPGRITWSTRRLACPDRLPVEGLRRHSTQVTP